ncbi:hypothetical protein D3C87_1743210 [compost metagenome]
MGGSLDVEGQALVFGLDPQGFQCRGQGLVQIERPQLQIQLAGFDAGHVQHVRDQPFQRDA